MEGKDAEVAVGLTVEIIEGMNRFAATYLAEPGKASALEANLETAFRLTQSLIFYPLYRVARGDGDSWRARAGGVP